MILRNQAEHSPRLCIFLKIIVVSYYILRDEGRREEAIAMFSIVIEEGPGCYLVLMERADLYDALGDKMNAERDRQEAEELWKGSRSRRGWPFKR